MIQNKKKRSNLNGEFFVQLDDTNPDIFIGYEEEQEIIDSFITEAIEIGKSTNLLIFGDCEIGKTSLVKKCLQKSELAQSCKILKLNGLIDSNDISTVRYIGKILEIKQTNLSELINEYKETYLKKKANLIVVIDEFDSFCGKNQYILYNFFDLMQYVKHILLIGITTRTDCCELLEKRVRSRFNHKQIILKPPFENFESYIDFAKKLSRNSLNFDKVVEKQLEKLYSITFSIRELKNYLLEIKIEQMFYSKKVLNKKKKLTTDLIENKIYQNIKSLSELELTVLLLSTNLVKYKNIKKFNCNYLFKFSNKIPSQMIFSKSVLFSVVGKLIDYGLFAIENNKKENFYLTEWTNLTLKILSNDIFDFVKKNEISLPFGIKKFLNCPLD